jgi:hypothetical protein
MLEKFSPELIERLKNYFLRKYQLQLTDEVASQYLDSLSGLYIALTEDEPFEPTHPDLIANHHFLSGGQGGVCRRRNYLDRQAKKMISS